MTTPTHPRVLVTGAGGFIGHHLVTALKQRGYWVRGVDITRPEYTGVDAGEFELETRIVRFHNIYGPYGTYDGGREKVPAALCRKVTEAEPGGEIEVWGDGEQTRSFCYVDDCVEGIYRLMVSDYPEPLNLGSEEMVTVNELARIVVEVSGLEPSYRWIEKQVISRRPPRAAAGR
jgi:nucleoside-diphosphate-sugar epimerase